MDTIILGNQIKFCCYWNSRIKDNNNTTRGTTRISNGSSTILDIPKARLQLVNCLVISRLSYSICIWGKTNDALIKKVQRVQNSAARLVSGLPIHIRQEYLMKSCRWLNIKNLTEYHSLYQIWKTVRWGAPEHIREKINIDDEYKLETMEPRLQLTAKS